MIGKMDRRITIRTYTTEQDDYGKEVKTWTDLAEVWAELIEGTAIGRGGGTEKEMLHAITATQNPQFRIRYRADINEEMVIRYGKDYGIKHIAEVGRKEYQVISTTDYE